MPLWTLGAQCVVRCGLVCTKAGISLTQLLLMPQLLHYQLSYTHQLCILHKLTRSL